jgi:hypothetical protein
MNTAKIHADKQEMTIARQVRRRWKSVIPVRNQTEAPVGQPMQAN